MTLRAPQMSRIPDTRAVSSFMRCLPLASGRTASLPTCGDCPSFPSL